MKSGSLTSIISSIIFLVVLGGLANAYGESLEWDQDLYMIEHSGILTLTLDSDPPGSPPAIWAVISIVGIDQIGVELTRDGPTQYSSELIKFTTLGPNTLNQLHIDGTVPVGFTARVTFPNTIYGSSTVTQLNLVELDDYNNSYKTKKSKFSVNQDICIDIDPNSPNPDIDGDGLCNIWETSTGLDIFTNPNGDHYTLPCNPASNYDDSPLGIDVCPDPNKPDIYFEIDSMVGHKPTEITLTQIVDAFRFSNHVTPRGVVGINAHIQLDEDDLPHVDALPSPGSNRNPGTDQLKKFWYGTFNERGGIIIPLKWTDDRRDLKNYAFHYVIFTHEREGALGKSGYSEIPGNDIMITLGGWDGMVGSPDTQAGTLLHEIGHNLDLEHGGLGDDTNCKANYISVMSFSRQTSDYISDRKVDFSQVELLDLNEGITGDQTTGSYGQQEVQIVYSDSPGNIFYSWTSSTPQDFGTPTSLTNFGITDCDDTDEEILQGSWDYDQLTFVAYGHANWVDGVSRGPTEISENLDNTPEIIRIQFEKSNDEGDLMVPSPLFPGNGVQVPPPQIPLDVCVKLNSNYNGTNPNPAFDRICVSDELTYEDSINIRKSKINSLVEIVMDTPDEHFVNPKEASSNKKEYFIQLEDIRDKITQGNMTGAINQTKIFQSWFDGEGEKEYIKNEQSRESIRLLTSEVLESQIKVVPEFETLAVIVLSISIISVIALTRRSQLNFSRIR